MTLPRVLALLGLALCGCPATVVPADGGAGGGGEAPSNGGFSAQGGLDGPGGFGFGGGSGGDGGQPPSPVPGCEQLAFVGDPIVLPPVFHPWQARAAALANGRVGIAYSDHDQGVDHLFSTTLEDPFGTWPPVINPAVDHGTFGINFPVGPIASRLDGTFSVGAWVGGILAFDQPGMVAPYPDHWAQAFPEPVHGSGVEGVTYDSPTLSFGLEVLPDLSTTTPVAIGSFPTPGCFTMRAVFDQGSTFYSSASDWYCEDAPVVQFHRVINGVLTTLGGFDLPFVPKKQTLAARPGGGYWYSVSNYDYGIVVYALDDSGSPIGEPWTDDYTYGDTSSMFQPWRDGFVVSKRTEEGISVFVSDGYNLTPSAAQNVMLTSSNAEIAMVVGGPNDSSILFAYPALDGIAVFRADCHSLEE